CWPRSRKDMWFSDGVVRAHWMNRLRNAFQGGGWMKGRAALLCLGLAVALDAGAATFSTDASDLWYASPAESESGWGVNVSQQGNVLFLTMFVYGSGSQPTWLVGSNTAYS